ncbi:MAG: hypothetical protein KatS3mg124_0268 [Porticoccaceae bacterium]|nr:MAG: hypothetical protein KatS3mg124_0268 [Porticoccaceae bacterium]
MAYGDASCDAALREAWRTFCRRLEEAGERVFKDYNPPLPQHRADGFRFLTQNLGQAFQLALETRDPRYPEIHAFVTPYCKLGADCADFVYQQAWISGDAVYRVSGNRGTCRFLNFTVQGERPDRIPGTDAPSLHEPFGDLPEANLFGHQLETAWDGSFELYIGGEPRGPNWLPTTPKSRKLFIRQGFDRWDEEPASLRIERIDMAEPRPLPTPEALVEAMDWAGRFLLGMMDDWPDHPIRHSPAVDPTVVNAFPEAVADSAEDRKRGRAAANLYWELAPDQALIVEFEAGRDFWMVTNMGPFMTSMDYLYRPVSYTPARTAVDPDGRVRLVLAHRDPGVANWLDTQGFVCGHLTFRSLLSGSVPRFATRTVPLGALFDALPAETRRCTPEERRAEMWRRFRAIRRRYRL